MLLPSALTCDPSHSSHSHSYPHSLAPHPRLQPGLFVSPPASPPTMSSQTAFGSIATTCLSLQSLIAAPITSVFSAASASPPSLTQLPTPPLAHAPPPLKLRLRSRRPSKVDNGAAGDDAPTARRRVVKRAAPPRGVNKRRRGDEDDMGRDEAEDNDFDSDAEAAATPPLSSSSSPLPQSPAAPSTPKRARIAPEHLPLGLERSDFHTVHILEKSDPSNLNSKDRQDQQPDAEPESAEWSAEDDRILVELVLDKLKLTKTEWQNCARGLGKDRHSVSRRWKSLIMNGDVGLKTRGGGRRAKLHATWR